MREEGDHVYIEPLGYNFISCLLPPLKVCSASYIAAENYHSLLHQYRRLIKVFKIDGNVYYPFLYIIGL